MEGKGWGQRWGRPQVWGKVGFPPLQREEASTWSAVLRGGRSGRWELGRDQAGNLAQENLGVVGRIGCGIQNREGDCRPPEGEQILS